MVRAQEKAIVIRLTRIVYAFRNHVWPKPMEGLDLFSPVVSNTDSSSSEEDNDSGAEFDGSSIILDRSDFSYEPRPKR